MSERRYLGDSEINFLQTESFVENKRGRKRKVPYYLIIQTLLHTGLRVSELCSLIPQDINFSERIIHVRGKGGNKRSVDINTEISSLLRLHIANKKIKVKEKVFPYHRSSINKMMQKYKESWGPHMLRHTYAKKVLENVGNIRFLQKQLGHKSLNTTAQYLKMLPFKKQKELLENLMNEE